MQYFLLKLGKLRGSFKTIGSRAVKKGNTSNKVSCKTVLPNSEMNLEINKFVSLLSVIVENKVVMSFGEIPDI